MARIAVIGAGMGAMAAAARLAVAGHSVAVYERAETYGGGVRRFERDGFGFDTGPGLLHLPAVYRDLFVKTGREPLESCVELSQVDPAARHVFADGTDLSLPNASRAGVVAALDTAFGTGAGERWSELINRARDVWDATRRPLLEEPLGRDRRMLGRDPYPTVVKRGLFGRRARAEAGSLAETALRELRDPRLAALLRSHALAYGFDPRTAPASATVLPYVEQTFGTWYVRGGIRALAEALFERCRARGVEFHFGAEVADVAFDDKRAIGVELSDGRRVEADTVVSGIDARRLYSERWTPYNFGPARPWPDEGPLGCGRFTVLLALSGARPADVPHRTVVHAADPAAELAALDGRSGSPCALPTVTVLRPDDPSLRPDDAHEPVVLTVTVPRHRPAAGTDRLAGDGHRDWERDEAGAMDWTAAGLTERYADQVVAAADAAVPGLAERVMWREVRTPVDTERETGAPGGSLPGPALAGARGEFLRADNRSPLAGLYLAGGSAHPGGGLAHAGMSGALVAGLIVEGDDWRGSQ
ncbi:NAD(P)/FAD-dependent oxidoreductase [Streptomyces sp. NPDC004647]|uniref:phytoene desaturase family protein n=1 Tax=Streptomyces sp. NPDC004647 TaxID=3154671 RepID=UPI0033AA33B7